MSRTPARLSLPVVRGSTWEDFIDYTDEAGEPVDLTGFKARMQVWTPEDTYLVGATPVLTLESDGAAPRMFIEAPPGSGVVSRVRIHVDIADVQLLNPSNVRKLKLTYGIELFKPAGAVPEYVLPLANGKLSVYGERVR